MTLISKKNNILSYPKFIIQADADLKEQGVKTHNKSLYQILVEANILKQSGEPTEWIMENGHLKEA